MRKHLNTLYVTTQGAYLSKDGDTVVASVDRKRLVQIPLLNLESIVCFGNVSCSPFLLGSCAENGVAVSLLTENGRFLARVTGKISGNVLLRRQQYRIADSIEPTFQIVRAIVAGKIVNTRLVLQRGLRDRPGSIAGDRIEGVVSHLAGLLTRLERADSTESVRGVEGAAARAYFEVFDELILHQKDSFTFDGRSRRPPRDRMNALLSFLYTLVVHDSAAALEGVGLDPAVGFLHTDRPGRSSCALDLAEEFRLWFADRLGLTLVNLRQLSAADFRDGESGAVLLNDNGRKVVLRAYQERKKDEMMHPFMGERVTVGILPHVQALLLARHVRGDLDAYPPFVWK